MNGANVDVHSLHRDTKQPDFQHSCDAPLSWKWKNPICRGVFLKFQSVKVSSTKAALGRCRLLQVRCSVNDSITDTISQTGLSNNPALDMCFLNRVQARLFPTEESICLGQWVGTPWHQSKRLLFLWCLKRRHLNTTSTVVAYLLPNILISRQHFCVREQMKKCGCSLKCILLFWLFLTFDSLHLQCQTKLSWFLSNHTTPTTNSHIAPSSLSWSFVRWSRVKVDTDTHDYTKLSWNVSTSSWRWYRPLLLACAKCHLGSRVSAGVLRAFAMLRQRAVNIVQEPISRRQFYVENVIVDFI